MTDLVVAVALVAGAYLVGSISPSVFLGRLVKGIDVREHGSGNAGATNAFRVLGTRLGIGGVGGRCAERVPPGAARPLSVGSLCHGTCGDGRDGRTQLVGLPEGEGRKGRGHRRRRDLGHDARDPAVLVAVFVVVLALTSTVSLASLAATILFPVLTIATPHRSPTWSSR